MRVNSTRTLQVRFFRMRNSKIRIPLLIEINFLHLHLVLCEGSLATWPQMPPPQYFLYGAVLLFTVVALWSQSRSLGSSHVGDDSRAMTQAQQLTHQLIQKSSDDTSRPASRPSEVVRRLRLHPAEVEKQDRWCRAMSGRGSGVRDLKAAFDQNVAA